ncbi:unnamed protein product, partial [marine sediment metagenome]
TQSSTLYPAGASPILFCVNDTCTPVGEGAAEFHVQSQRWLSVYIT